MEPSWVTVRIKAAQHKRLKIMAAREGKALSDLLSGVIADGMSGPPLKASGCCFAGVGSACPIHERKP